MKCRSCSNLLPATSIGFCSEECLNHQARLKGASLSAALDEAAVLTQKLKRAAQTERELEHQRDEAMAQLKALQAERDRALAWAHSLQQELAALRAAPGQTSRESELEATVEELKRKLAESDLKLNKAIKAADQLQARIVELEFELSEKHDV